MGARALRGIGSWRSIDERSDRCRSGTARSISAGMARNSLSRGRVAEACGCSDRRCGNVERCARLDGWRGMGAQKLASWGVADQRPAEPPARTFEIALLAGGSVMDDVDEPLTCVHFMATAARLVTASENRITVEAATAGREGAVGVAAFLLSDENRCWPIWSFGPRPRADIVASPADGSR